MKCTISQVYFGKELYMFRTDLLSILHEKRYIFLNFYNLITLESIFLITARYLLGPIQK